MSAGNVFSPVVPVILAGGKGSRLWPLTRGRTPKALLDITGQGRTAFEDVLARLSFCEGLQPPVVVCAQEHAAAIEARLPQGGHVIAESCPRDTAAAVMLAALWTGQRQPDALLLVLPCDHVMEETAVAEVLQKAIPVAQAGHLVCFGVKPSRPATGYGYLQQGEALAGGGWRLQRFIEKPDQTRAEIFCQQKEMFWNSGMFLLPCTLLTEEMRQHAPQISAACASGEMQDCPARSLDYALMEHTDKAAMVVWPGRWSDAGSWEELWHLADQDVRGNACLGDALLIDAQECYVRVEGGPPVSLCGAEHLVVVSTADGILIADKRRPELLRKITPQ